MWLQLFFSGSAVVLQYLPQTQISLGAQMCSIWIWKIFPIVKLRIIGQLFLMLGTVLLQSILYIHGELCGCGKSCGTWVNSELQVWKSGLLSRYRCATAGYQGCPRMHTQCSSAIAWSRNSQPGIGTTTSFCATGWRAMRVELPHLPDLFMLS